MSRNRQVQNRARDEAPSQFQRLLEVERRLGAELEAARRRAEALVESVQLSVREREARLNRALAQGFPEVEERIVREQEQRIATLVDASRREARAFQAVDDDTIDRLAAEVVNRLLDDS